MPMTTLQTMFVLMLLMVSASVSEEIDELFMSSQVFSSAVRKGLGNAGVALPYGVHLGWYNPALVFSSCKNRGGNILSFGYGRDSLFDRHGIPVVFAHVEGDGAMGGFYRFLSGNSGMSQQEFGINFSGQLFDKVDAQGEVDFGVNLRYVMLSDTRYETHQHPVERYMVDSATHEELLGVMDSTDNLYRGDASMRRFVVDMGFYQPDIMPHLDFGLTVTNLTGYRWEHRNPWLASSDSLAGDTLVGADTNSIVIRNYQYRDETKKDRGYLASRYRTLIIGVVYRTGTESFRLFLPVDLVLRGLFDKKLENGFVFRGGVAAELGSAVTVRIGYAREPKTIIEGVTSFKNVNIFTGGAGMRVGGSTFDFYMSDDTFGFTSEYRF